MPEVTNNMYYKYRESAVLKWEFSQFTSKAPLWYISNTQGKNSYSSLLSKFNKLELIWIKENTKD